MVEGWTSYGVGRASDGAGKASDGTGPGDIYIYRDGPLRTSYEAGRASEGGRTRTELKRSGRKRTRSSFPNGPLPKMNRRIMK